MLILQTIFRASAGLGDIGELKAWHILNIANILTLESLSNDPRQKRIYELSRATANYPPLLILSGALRPGNWTPFDSISFP